MKNILAVAFMLPFCLNVSVAQTGNPDQVNHEKYWKYRDRLRHQFIRIGDDQGESLIMSGRKPNKDCNAGPGNPNYQSLRWGDCTMRMGYYIGTLAMEYKLLKNAGEDVTATLNELYYALQAINRLDNNAEFHRSSGNALPDLNGFFIRDDVFDDFYLNFEDDDPIEKSRCVQSNFEKEFSYSPSGNSPAGFYEGFSSNNVETFDQLAALIMGLALVNKFVDNVPAPVDPSFLFIVETKNMVDRLISYVENQPTANLYQRWTVSDWNGSIIPNAGNDLSFLSYPFSVAGRSITGFNYQASLRRAYLSDILIFEPDDFEDLWKNQLSIFPWAQYSLPQMEQEVYLCYDNVQIAAFWHPGPNPPVSSAIGCHSLGLDNILHEYDVSNIFQLIAISGIWDQADLRFHCGTMNLEALELVYAIMHDTTSLYAKSDIQGLLTDAPCAGTFYPNGTNYDFNGVMGPVAPNWQSDMRWDKPSESINGNNVAVEHRGLYPGIDWMFLYNAYHLLYESTPNFPDYEETYNCNCVNEIVSPSVNIINNTTPPANNTSIPVTVEQKFDDYDEIGIRQRNYLAHDVTVTTDGFIQVEELLTICNTATLTLENGTNHTNGLLQLGTNNRLGSLEVLDGSTIITEDNGHLHFQNGSDGNFNIGSFYVVNSGGDLVVTDNSTLQVDASSLLDISNVGDGILIDNNSTVNFSQANIKVGTNGTIRINNNSTLTLSGNSVLRLQSPSQLVIDNGSRLVIEEGARIIYEDGASITLADANSVLEIRGVLQLESNAVFQYTGDGFVFFNVTNPINNFNIQSDPTASFQLTGNTRSHKVLEVLGGSVNVDPDLSLFRIFNATVQMNTIAEISVPGAIQMVNSDINGGNVTVYGDAFMNFNNCLFDGSRINGHLFVFGNALPVTNCDFQNSGVAMSIEGGGINLLDCSFNNIAGCAIELAGINLPSFCKNVTMNVPDVGVLNVSPNAELTLDNTAINSAGTFGVYHEQDQLNLKCSNVDAPFGEGFYLTNNARLNSSTLLDGGYSNLSGSYTCIRADGAEDLFLDAGYNNLITGADNNLSQDIVSGYLTINTSQNISLAANDNTWMNNNTIDPNNDKISLLSIDGDQIELVDNNRGATAVCGQFDVGGPSTTNAHSPLTSCDGCPMITGPDITAQFLNTAIQEAIGNMELTDPVNGDDFLALRQFEQLLTSGLDQSDADVAFLTQLAYQKAKSTLQNCFLTGKTTKGQNVPTFANCAQSFMNIITALKAPVTQENYKQQFYYDIDEAMGYRLAGRYTEAIQMLENIDNCFLQEPERKAVQYWKELSKLEEKVITGVEPLENTSILLENLPTIVLPQPTFAQPTANINDDATIGSGVQVGNNTTIKEDAVIGNNVILGDNVTIKKQAVIGDGTVIGDNTVVKEKAEIGKNTIIGQNVTIKEKAIIGSQVQIENDATIHEKVVLSDWVTVAANANIKDKIIVADGSFIGSDVVIKKKAVIGTNTIIRKQSDIKDKAIIGNQVIIAAQATIRSKAEVGENVIIDAGITVGEKAEICDNEIVSSNVSNNSTQGNCSNPTEPTEPLNGNYDAKFALEHAKKYENFFNGFTLKSNETILTGKPVQFVPQSITGTYLWDFGDCSTSTEQSPTYTFAESGIYVISLTQGNTCASTTTYGAITVYPDPNSDPDPEVPPCPTADSTKLKAITVLGSTGTPACLQTIGGTPTYISLDEALCRINYVWNIDNNSIQQVSGLDDVHNNTIAPVYYQLNSDGEYECTLTTNLEVMNLTTGTWTSTTQSHTATETITLENVLTATIFPPADVCTPGNAQFMGDASGGVPPYTFDWSFSNGYGTFEQSPLVPVNSIGSLFAILKVTDSTGCEVIDTLTLNITDCNAAMALNISEQTEGQQAEQEISEEKVNTEPENVSKPTAPNFKLYPNPNNGQMTLEYRLPANLANCQLVIRDMAGRLIKSFILNRSQPSFKIDVSELVNGIYLIHVLSGGNPIYNSKVTIVK